MYTRKKSHDVGRTVTLVFSLVGIAFLVVDVFVSGIYFQRQSRCTLSVTAEVVDYNSHLERNASKRTSGTYYYPVVAFDVEGQPFQVQLDTGTTFKPYDLGEELEVMCNPADPSDLYAVGVTSYLPLLLGSIFGLLGLVLLFLSVYFTLCEVKRARNPHW